MFSKGYRNEMLAKNGLINGKVKEYASLDMSGLTHFSPMIHFYTRQYVRKNHRLSGVFRGIAMEHWTKMG